MCGRHFVQRAQHRSAVTACDLDKARSRALLVASGIVMFPRPVSRRLNECSRWRPLISPAMVFFASDRNREDLDRKAGAFTWRYKNKLTLRRTVPIHSYHAILYTAAEPYYTSQCKKWSTTDLYAGALLPVGKHVRFNCYIEHETIPANLRTRRGTTVAWRSSCILRSSRSNLIGIGYQRFTMSHSSLVLAKKAPCSGSLFI
jgi:hypothetical protein